MNRRSVKLLTQLFVLAAVLIGTMAAARAQSISFYDRNGHRIGDGQPFPYDRFARGERATVRVTSPYYPMDVVISADNGIFREHNDWWGPYSYTFTVPEDPAFDNCYVDVFTPYTWVWKRLPIGRK